MTDYTTTVRAYNNIPFEYRLKKDGYYDIVGSTKGGNNVTGLIFWTYNGLNMSYEQVSDSPMVVTANSGMLPDLTDISGVTGCLKEAGGGPGLYTNYTTNGSPSVDIYTGLVSNMSSSNYLIPTGGVTPDNKTWEIVIKFTTGSSLPSGANMCCTTGTYSSYPLQMGSSIVAFMSSNGGSWDIASGVSIMSVAVNTTYKIKVEFTGTEYNWYSYENDEWVLKKTITSSTPVRANAQYKIGDGFGNGGIVDLSETYMKVDGQIAWTPAVGNGYIAKVSADNFTLIGSPTIDSDKVVSNFSNSNYLNVDETIPSSYTSMDIIFKANFTSLTSHNCLLGIQSGSGNWFGTRNTGYFATYSGSWVTGTTVLSTGTDYWFRVINNGTTSTGYLLVDNNYTLDTLPDISQWSQEWTTTNYNIKNQKLRVGYNGTSGEYCSGSIDLKGCNINIDGNDFWNPLVINTAVDGLLPSGVTDDGSAQTWNLFYNNGDYRLNTTSTMTGYTWVGSVAIPAHTV